MEDQFKDGTYEIVGSAMKVQNELGFGLREKPYENALAIELEYAGFSIEQQQAFPILYRNRPVGDCIPDITIHSHQILVEAKAVESIGEKEIAQMLNYLRITRFKVGLIVNFGSRKVEWKRLVL